MTVSVKKMVSALIRNRPVASTLQWQGTSNVVFHLIDKVNNKILAWEPSFAWKQSLFYKSQPFLLRPLKPN